MKEGTSLREGDVYYWQYKDHEEYCKRNQSTAYWCLDRKAVVYNGELVDTYWTYLDKDGIRVSSDCHRVNPENVELEFICNLNDVEIIHKREKDDYDKVYDLSCQKGCYEVYAVDKDAKVSNTALRKKYNNLLEKAYSDKRSAEYEIEYYSKLIKELGD